MKRPVPPAVLSRRFLLSAVVVMPALLRTNSALAQSDPLPSWNDGASKSSITNFVARVTTQGAIGKDWNIHDLDRRIDLRNRQSSFDIITARLTETKECPGNRSVGGRFARKCGSAVI